MNIDVFRQQRNNNPPSVFRWRLWTWYVTVYLQNQKEKEATDSLCPVYWVASRDDDTSTYYVKLANYNASATTATIVIDGVTSGTITTLTGPDESSENEVGDSGVVVPVSEAITASGGSYTISLPAYAVVVVALKESQRHHSLSNSIGLAISLGCQIGVAT